MRGNINCYRTVVVFFVVVFVIVVAVEPSDQACAVRVCVEFDTRQSRVCAEFDMNQVVRLEGEGPHNPSMRISRSCFMVGVRQPCTPHRK